MSPAVHLTARRQPRALRHEVIDVVLAPEVEIKNHRRADISKAGGWTRRQRELGVVEAARSCAVSERPYRGEPNARPALVSRHAGTVSTVA